MTWLFWYLMIGLIVGAYGKATSDAASGALYADLITLVLFTVGWPFVIAWIINSGKRKQ